LAREFFCLIEYRAVNYIISFGVRIFMIERITDTLQGKAPLSAKRSPKWSSVRKEFLKSNPVCACCGGVKKLQVHHIKPFHTHPELELDTDNLITLCRRKKYGIDCHLLVGHLGWFKNINNHVIEDSQLWNQRLKERNF
jgi:hypothetical protein